MTAGGVNVVIRTSHHYCLAHSGMPRRYHHFNYLSNRLHTRLPLC